MEALTIQLSDNQIETIAREVADKIASQITTNTKDNGKGERIQGISKIAEALGISRSTLYNLKKKGVLNDVIYNQLGDVNIYFAYSEELKAKRLQIEKRLQEGIEK